MSTHAPASRPALVISIVVILALAHIFPLFGFTSPGLQENRVLAQWPSPPVNFQETLEYPRNVDSFINDQFPPRKHVVSTLNYFRFKLGFSNLKQVAVGPRGWLFHDNGRTFDFHLGNGILQEDGQQLWIDRFKAFSTFVEERGAKYYVLAAPLKTTIYPEEAPYWMPHGRNEAIEITAKLNASGFSRVVHPAAEISQQKPKRLLYSRHDTHWNVFGAYEAYKMLASRFAQDFEQISAPLPFTAFSDAEAPEWTIPRDLALMLGIADKVTVVHPSWAPEPLHDPDQTQFLEERKDWTAGQIIHTSSKTGLKLLLVRDSFSRELVPFLKPHFSEIILTHIQDGFFRADLIEKFKPDAVVLEVQEAGLRYAIFPG